MNEDVRIYFCPGNSEKMEYFRKTGAKLGEEKRVPSVAKFSRLRLILKDAKKPSDGRYKKRGDRVDTNSNM